MIDQHTTHRGGCGTEEARAIVGAECRTRPKAQIRLMDECRGAEGVSRPLASQLGVCKAPQFGVEPRSELVGRQFVIRHVPHRMRLLTSAHSADVQLRARVAPGRGEKLDTAPVAAPQSIMHRLARRVKLISRAGYVPNRRRML